MTDLESNKNKSIALQFGMAFVVINKSTDSNPITVKLGLTKSDSISKYTETSEDFSSID